MVKRVSVKYTVTEIHKITFPLLSKQNITSKLKIAIYIKQFLI